MSGIAVDKAGNSATAAVALNIDLTTPTVSADASPAATGRGWNKSPVVTFAAVDALSGVSPKPDASRDVVD